MKDDNLMFDTYSELYDQVNDITKDHLQTLKQQWIDSIKLPRKKKKFVRKQLILEYKYLRMSIDMFYNP